VFVGSWQHIWLLTLPFVALFLPAIIIAIIASTIWPDEKVPLPPTLALPKWFSHLPHYRMLRHPEVGEVLFYGGPGVVEEDEESDKENAANQQQ